MRLRTWPDCFANHGRDGNPGGRQSEGLDAGREYPQVDGGDVSAGIRQSIVVGQATVFRSISTVRILLAA